MLHTYLRRRGRWLEFFRRLAFSERPSSNEQHTPPRRAVPSPRGREAKQGWCPRNPTQLIVPWPDSVAHWRSRPERPTLYSSSSWGSQCGSIDRQRREATADDWERRTGREGTAGVRQGET